MGMETESGRDGEMEARREMGGGAKEEWRERERDRDRQTERQTETERDGDTSQGVSFTDCMKRSLEA